jgi:hypothetical protein
MECVETPQDLWLAALEEQLRLFPKIWPKFNDRMMNSSSVWNDSQISLSTMKSACWPVLERRLEARIGRATPGRRKKCVGSPREMKPFSEMLRSMHASRISRTSSTPWERQLTTNESRH